MRGRRPAASGLPELCSDGALPQLVPERPVRLAVVQHIAHHPAASDSIGLGGDLLLFIGWLMIWQIGGPR